MKFYRRTAIIGVFLSLAIVFSYIEMILGFNSLMPVYGIKIGFYNIVIIVAMFYLGFAEALGIMALRSIIMSVMFGSITSFVFSITGGLMSFFVMACLIKSRLFGKYISLVGVSVAGASFFNFGQIIGGVIVTEQTAIFYYLPVLLACSVFTGAIIGMAARKIIKAIR